MTPRVVRRERPSLLVGRGVPDEMLVAGVRQRMHGAVQPELRKLLGLALAWAEAGTPKQPLGLGGSELPPVRGDLRHLAPSSSALREVGLIPKTREAP